MSLLCLATLATNVSAFAQSDSRAPLLTAYEALSTFTIPLSSKNDTSGCSLVGLADFEGYKPHLNVFREDWFNPQYSLDFYAQRIRQVFIYIVMKRFAEIMTQGIYMQQGPPECSFTTRITYLDMGQRQYLDAATWRFTLQHASTVNWETIDPADFDKIALDYNFGPQVQNWISNEPSLLLSEDEECDPRFMRTNAIFIRAITYCAKNYMDTPAAYYALSKARQCARKISTNDISAIFIESAKELDNIAKLQGKINACRFVEQIEIETTAMIP